MPDRLYIVVRYQMETIQSLVGLAGARVRADMRAKLVQGGGPPERARCQRRSRRLFPVSGTRAVPSDFTLKSAELFAPRTEIVPWQMWPLAPGCAFSSARP
jgi:hypothetical protein